MIKINLLENHLSVPEPHAKAVTSHDTSAGKTIRAEARKSYRFLIFLIILIIVIIAGSVFGYIYRYPVVEFVEQYTGPLNLLSPPPEEIPLEVLEEQRRERVRIRYMDNTFKIQKRDLHFIKKLDSLDKADDRLWISNMTLDGNDFNIDAFGKKDDVFAALSKNIILIPSVETVKPSEVKVSSVAKGYSLKSNITGSLRIPPESPEESLKPHKTFLSTDQVKKQIESLAAKYKIKLSEPKPMAHNKGVVMDKYRGHLRLEGLSSDLISFFSDFASQSINAEWISYNFVYTYQKFKKALKPDVCTLEYDVLIPPKAAETTGSASK